MAWDLGKLFSAFGKALEVAVGFIPPEDETAKAAATAVMKAAPAVTQAIHEKLSDHSDETKQAATHAALATVEETLGATLTGGAKESFDKISPAAHGFLEDLFGAWNKE
jgi:hypothetical protein